MRLVVELDPASLLGWHLDMLARLEAVRDLAVAVRWRPSEAEPLPTCLSVLFSLEEVLHGRKAGLAAPADPSELTTATAPTKAPADRILDLTEGDAADGLPRWHLTFDGVRGLGAAVAPILEGRTPLVAIVDARSGLVATAGHAGADDPHIALATFESALARATTLIVAAARGVGPGAMPDGAATTLRCSAVLKHGTKAIARAAIHRIYRLLYRSPHWRVGWRYADGPATLALGHHPETGWRDLPDDGTRFYADPFPIVVEGRHWLFVEDLPHATQKGVISAVAFGEDGPIGTPEPVLDLPYHLSYPFVFEADGEIWMVPETSSARRIELFRARRFPGGWEREAILVDETDASDATLFRHADRWWMGATVRDGDSGSCSDVLHLWSARDVRGPWTPHPGNPVLVDVASARPAGRVESVDGKLIRPVQDCRGGYGAALALAEITRLDAGGFAQRVTGRLTAGPLWPGRRIHTLNRAGRLECIDGSALAPRWRRSSVPG